MTVRIELQCDTCRSAYFKARTEDVIAAREAAKAARWTRPGWADVCPRCTPVSSRARV